MRLRWVFTILLFFSFESFSNASALDAVCDVISQAKDCKAVISYPTFAVKNCKQDWFRVDKCKTKLKGRYPCGVSWSGVKWCDGWTCVPGTVKDVITVPCGINVGSKKVDMCGLIKLAIPGYSALLQQGVGYCRCLPKVFDLISLSTFKSIISSYDVSAGSREILEQYGEIQQCLVDNAFNIKDNKVGLSSGTGPLVQSNSVKVFTAAEINLARYSSFAAALAPCFVATCSETLIRGWFMDYLSDSEKLMATQLKSFLDPWEQAFDGVKSGFDTIGSDLDQIGTQLGTVKQSVEDIANDFCKNFTSCADTTIIKLKTKIETTIQNSQAVVGLKTQVTTVVTDTQQLVKIISDAINAFETLSDYGIDEIWDKVLHGGLRSITDIAETLQAAKRLPNIISDLQKVLPNVQKYAKQLQDVGPQFSQDIDDIVSTSWLNDARADAARYANGEAAVKKIQQLFVDNVVPHTSSLIKSITSIINSLTSLALSGAPSIDVRVASYSRWSEGSFDMACLSTGKLPVSMFGFKITVDYPKFERCPQPYKIPFPNHHIPYVKIVFSSSTSPPPAMYLARREVGIDEPSSSVEVAVPTATASAWPYVSEVPGTASDIASATVDPSLVVDPSATETVIGQSTSFAIPSGYYSNSNEVPPPETTYPPDVVFFETTDANGAAITAQTTLTNGSSIEVTSTEVVPDGESTVGDPSIYATPSGFVEGALSASSVAVSSTPPATFTASSRASAASSTASETAKSGGLQLMSDVGFMMVGLITALICSL